MSSLEISFSPFELEQLKNKIESMSKHNHIEILNIIKNTSSVKLNENKSGVFINLTLLSKNALSEINKFIDYIDEQESSIRQFENKHEEFKNTFFIEKEDKDNIVSYSSFAK